MQKIAITRYEVESEKIDKEYKIALLADLHMKTEEWRVKQIISIIKRERPDYVFVAGDLITTYPAAYAGVRGDFSWATKIGQMMREIVEICQTFYVDGNHEIYLKESLDNAYTPIYDRLQFEIRNAGVIVLHNDSVRLDEQIVLYGHEFSYDYYRKHGKEDVSVQDIEHLIGWADKDFYTVLLTHDPTRFETYTRWGANLVVCGHMHGGVIRIGKRGLIGADRTAFPRYCYGEYHREHSTLIVTGGLGEHFVWKRMFNPPEVVILNLV